MKLYIAKKAFFLLRWDDIFTTIRPFLLFGLKKKNKKGGVGGLKVLAFSLFQHHGCLLKIK